MDKALKAHIEYQLCIRIEMVRLVSGGDISQAFLLETASERFFCKVNTGDTAYSMFLSEKQGLEAITQTKTIATPRVLLCEALESGGLLVMEFITSKKASPTDMTLLGHQLAALHHLSSNDSFGWETDNYIGSLPQSNNQFFNWTEFYVQERLLPQLKMACDAELLDLQEIPSEAQLLKTCNSLFPKVRPSLLHGDLWSGNFLVSESGTPFLIDPAVYYGHHEVDVAMTKLFGGFTTSFYDAYLEHFPEIGSDEERIQIYQLYYLLVHLNLFGSSYKPSVIRIMKRYF